MKIVSVIECLDDSYGGPANSLPNILNALKKNKNIDSVIISIEEGKGADNFYVKKYNLPWIKCQLIGSRSLRYSSDFSFLVNENLKKEDILFSNNLWNYPAFFSFMKSIFGYNHIISIRGALYPWSLSQSKLKKTLVWFLFQKLSLKYAKLIHVTCLEELQAVRELGIKTPIALIPHGINYYDYQYLPSRNESCQILSLEEDKKYFLFMSRLHRKKGLDILIDVWVKIFNENPDWCLIIAGPDSSDYTDRINELVLNNGLSKNLIIFPMLRGNEKLAVMSVSEFFVLPTFSENFGVVIGEALAAGLPVVTTTGAPWKSIEENYCGEIISLSFNNLRKSLESMFSKEDSEMNLMSNNAKRLILENYSWEIQVNKFVVALDYLSNGLVDDTVIYKY